MGHYLSEMMPYKTDKDRELEAQHTAWMNKRFYDALRRCIELVNSATELDRTRAREELARLMRF